MALQNLTVDTIGDLGNGGARLAINAAIAAILKDLEERGEQDGKARKVKIELVGVVDRGQVIFAVAAKPELPAFQTHNTTGTLMQRAGASGVQLLFAFQEHNAEGVDQPTFPEMDGEESA